MIDEKYMQMAIDLAQKGIGYVSPNPLVGAIIVKEDEVIGQGYHEVFGGWHAERQALENCQKDPTAGTLYVNLEPCCHSGKTPPCTEAILKSGIRRVVVGSLDPNPLVAGRGIAILEQNGLEVRVGVLKKSCDQLNEIFFHYIQHHEPYVTLKYAMTLDGKIATRTGESQWITGEEARVKVHQDRRRHGAIMVGLGTVMADNPMLTARVGAGRQPLRIICDTQLRTPIESKIIQSAREIPTLIATCSQDSHQKLKYEKYGCEILVVSKLRDKVDLKQLMGLLGGRGIDSVFIEGGSEINFAALEAGVVQKVQAYIGPQIFGGKNAKTPVAGVGIEKLDHSIRLKMIDIVKLGEDICIESEVEKECSQGL